MGDSLLPRSDIHVTDADAQAESGLTVADRRLLIGALEYKEKRQAVLTMPSPLFCVTDLFLVWVCMSWLRLLTWPCIAP